MRSEETVGGESGQDRQGSRGGDGLGTRVLRRRLSTRILVMAVLAVMLAEILIFLPSIAYFRFDWLQEKLDTAAVAGLAVDDTLGTALSEAPERDEILLRAVDAELIAIIEEGSSRLIARDADFGTVAVTADLRDPNPFALLTAAFDTLLFGSDRLMRITGPVGDGSLTGEVVASEAPLRQAMLVYARNILVLSLFVASIVALIVYLAIRRTLIRPIEAMTASMSAFAEQPNDVARIIRPSARADEIGLAEFHLSRMQGSLARTLREQRHLAELGLAVSKINHDLRNILASAHMISDRLSTIPDPQVQRMVPMLLKSLDRALAYTQSVLSYGRAVESEPARRRILLAELVDDVFTVLGVSEASRIDLINAVHPELEVLVDPDQFHRVLLNLARNAVQALEEEDESIPSIVRRITISGHAETGSDLLVCVEDTGPGLPARAREHLFRAFSGSTRSGGTGLGLAIVAEIVEAHGGRIALADHDVPGARFEIRLPDAFASPADLAVEEEAGLQLRTVDGREAGDGRRRG